MQTPPVQPTVQFGPWLMNANAAYYLYGLPFGVLLSIPAYMLYERYYVNRKAIQPQEAEGKPALEPGPDAAAAPAAKKPKRKSGSSGVLYIMLAFVGSDLIAQTAKMAFPGIPADAVVWGILSGLSAGFLVLAIVRKQAHT